MRLILTAHFKQQSKQIQQLDFQLLATTQVLQAVINQSIGHWRNDKPGMVVVKRQDNVAEDWFVWHTGLSSEANHYIELNNTGAETNQSEPREQE